MYKSTHFALHELVPKALFDKWGDRCWGLFDDRLLQTIDALRERFGSCTINDWFWGGNFQYSGLRDEVFYGDVQKYLNSRSQHKYGRAADCKFKNHTAQHVRRVILENPDEFPHIKFIETGPLADGRPMNWVHIDVRNGSLICWSPKNGVVSANDVIRNGL